VILDSSVDVVPLSSSSDVLAWLSKIFGFGMSQGFWQEFGFGLTNVMSEDSVHKLAQAR
jgi:hypothetical protein